MVSRVKVAFLIAAKNFPAFNIHSLSWLNGTYKADHWLIMLNKKPTMPKCPECVYMCVCVCVCVHVHMGSSPDVSPCVSAFLQISSPPLGSSLCLQEQATWPKVVSRGGQQILRESKQCHRHFHGPSGEICTLHATPGWSHCLLV